MGGKSQRGRTRNDPGTDRRVFAGGRLDLLADDAAAEAVRVREGPSGGRLGLAEGGDSGRAARYSAARRSTPDSGLASRGDTPAPRSARPVSTATRAASIITCGAVRCVEEVDTKGERQLGMWVRGARHDLLQTLHMEGVFPAARQVDGRGQTEVVEADRARLAPLERKERMGLDGRRALDTVPHARAASRRKASPGR